MLSLSRREFLHASALALAGTALLPLAGRAAVAKTDGVKVAIAACRGYGREFREALATNFDRLGGIGALVRNHTVTVKINLTGSDFRPIAGRPAGESYMTHPETAMALSSALFAAGAKRVRLIESTNLRQPLEATLVAAGWDVKALQALGKMEFEDTRNLGRGSKYVTLKVADGGRLFESFDLNQACSDTDVFVSLCKLKTHSSTGITMTMKNLFGLTPNALYGDDAPSENGTRGRSRLHSLKDWMAEGNGQIFDPPGAKKEFLAPTDGGFRLPRIVTDMCAARPIHLGIIDGITTLRHNEIPCNDDPAPLIVSPGVLICGFNPVATDTVGTAVMGFPNVRATRGTAPFHSGDNHLVLAEQAGLGPADLSKIEVIGDSIDKVRSREFA